MAITQKSRIQVRQGKIDELPQLASGELGWAIDTQQIFIGNGTPAQGAPIVGNTEILTSRSSIVRNPLTSTIVIEVSDQPGHTLEAGKPVYFDGTEWQLASAANEATYATGIVSLVEGPVFKVVLYGKAELGGFTPGTYYYTSDTIPGDLVTVAPDSKNLVLYAISNSEVIVAPGLPTSANVYNRAAPMEISVGGAQVGTTFSGTIQQALDKILYPYIEPTFLSFTAAFPGSQPYEVGQILPTPGPYTFSWTNSSPANITTDSIVIEDLTNQSGPGFNLPAFSPFSVTGNPGSQAVAFDNNIQRTTEGTYSFRISGDGIDSGTFSRTLSVEWQWRMFYGSSALTVLNENEVEALGNGLQASPNSTYSFTTPGYKYIAYPKSFGTRSLFFDTTQGLGVSMQPPFEVSLTNTHGVQALYYVYRTTNQLAGNINIQIQG